MGIEAIVPKLPKCDICGKTAVYDCKTKMGSWGNLCEVCFKTFGIGLGTGKGQKLIEAPPTHSKIVLEPADYKHLTDAIRASKDE